MHVVQRKYFFQNFLEIFREFFLVLCLEQMPVWTTITRFQRVKYVFPLVFPVRYVSVPQYSELFFHGYPLLEDESRVEL